MNVGCTHKQLFPKILTITTLWGCYSFTAPKICYSIKKGCKYWATEYNIFISFWQGVFSVVEQSCFFRQTWSNWTKFLILSVNIPLILRHGNSVIPKKSNCPLELQISVELFNPLSLVYFLWWYNMQINLQSKWQTQRWNEIKQEPEAVIADCARWHTHTHTC